MTETLSWANRHARKQQPTPVLQPITPTAPGGGYGQRALALELDELRQTTEGGRNARLNTASFSLHQLVASGHLTETEVHDQLRAVALSIGLTSSETEATIASGRKAGEQQPRQVKPLQLVDNVQEVSAAEIARASPAATTVTREVIDEGTGEVTEDQVDFWETRPYLAHIKTFAYSRMCAPWAVLGVTLLRALSTVPPKMTLPPLVGGPGSLNLFCALVGSSGVGKGAAEAAAADAVMFSRSVYTASVGSGEGIAHQYAHREKGGVVYDRDAVLFTVPEVDTLTALGQRQGSTLLSQLRSAFSGERLGFGYADALKRIPIERHAYRLGMTVGVQPEKAGPLLDDADGGTPQRFIWVSATDPDITADPPEQPTPWTAPEVRWSSVRYAPSSSGLSYIEVPADVARTVREHHASRARGEGDGLDGHSLFARLKVAAAFAVLDGRPYVDDEDWQLSGVVMAVSDHTRAVVTATVRSLRQRSEAARAEAGAQRAVAADEAIAEAGALRTCRNVLRHVPTTGRIGAGELRKRVAQRDRTGFEDALARLVAAGQVVVIEEERHDSPTGIGRQIERSGASS